jgi:hypothetical protein
MNNEIVKLFQEKTDAMFGVLQEMIYQEGQRIMAEISMHRRDEHLKYWDHNPYLEYTKEQREKISNLRNKMDEASKKLTELIKINTKEETKGIGAFY